MRHLHSSSNEEITPEQRHIASTAIIVSKMLKLERRNFNLYQQPLRLLVNADPLSTADFQVPVRFMELMDPKRTMMAIEQISFKCLSPITQMAQPPINFDRNTAEIVFGNLYIDCDTIPAGTVYDGTSQSYSKNLKSVPLTYGVSPNISPTTLDQNEPKYVYQLSAEYSTVIKSNDISFPISDTNFVNNSNIRFLIRLGFIRPDYADQIYKTYPMFNLGLPSTGPSPDRTRNPVDTLNGYLTFQIVFYRYAGNDLADEE